MTVVHPLAADGSHYHFTISCGGSGKSGGMIMSDSGSGYTVAPGAVAARQFSSRMPSIPCCSRNLFRGVLTRRVFAFLIDLVVLSIPVILAYMSLPCSA